MHFIEFKFRIYFFLNYDLVDLTEQRTSARGEQMENMRPARGKDAQRISSAATVRDYLSFLRVTFYFKPFYSNRWFQLRMQFEKTRNGKD